MKYVISDIHGDYSRYIEMLEKINFNQSDVLFVLGDVIDRGAHGIKILQHMMQHSNIVPILGNHELMAYKELKFLSREITEESLEEFDEERLQQMLVWMCNGGEPTLKEFRALSVEERKEILDYIREFWGFFEVEAGGKTYLLVHAGFENFEQDKLMEEYCLEELVWARMDPEKRYFIDKVLVVGHTPTRAFYAKRQGKLLEEIPKIEQRDEVFVSEDGMLIGIDCGCGFDGRLASFCLDTGEVVYV